MTAQEAASCADRNEPGDHGPVELQVDRGQYLQVLGEACGRLQGDYHQAAADRQAQRQAAQQHQGRHDQEAAPDADEPRYDADCRALKSHGPPGLPGRPGAGRGRSEHERGGQKHDQGEQQHLDWSGNEPGEPGSEYRTSHAGQPEEQHAAPVDLAPERVGEGRDEADAPDDRE